MILKNNIKPLILSILLAVISIKQFVAQTKQSEKPNLVIIHTDEHNLRTIGAYRETMSEEQAFMWGKEAVVSTPNIDKLAKEGTLCTNWYATSPVCTPSRASMVSGLYPIATGSHINDLPLNDDVITFAQILKDNGYATSYVGKWHLDGDDKPGIHPDRSFGFTDNKYMINRGHWKVLGENEEGFFVDQKLSKQGGGQWEPEKANEETFTTDFLTDRTLEIIERDSDKPFCVMLSLPDPHGPNQVRAPYDTMYSNIKFENPRTMFPTKEQTPGWINLNGKKNTGKKVNQQAMAQYFGMVKCIDDNVGRILSYLKENNLEENTIVIFTSDHGDLLYEHQKLNKGNPYEMSARVPFIMRYPKKVKAQKTIQKAYTMADFTPTILGLMDVDHSEYKFHGIDASKDFESNKMKIVDDRTVYITNANKRWVAAVNNRYKLVLSPSDKPWLFDLEKDPDELTNFYNHKDYKDIAKRMSSELYVQMDEYNEPLKKEKIQK
jgi:arylsulfatase A-like enzyme